jgi:hypothetical protein
MNQHILQPALQCGAWHQVYDQERFMIDSNFDIEKFAELIIRECINATGNCAGTGDMIKEHFGIE